MGGLGSNTGLLVMPDGTLGRGWQGASGGRHAGPPSSPSGRCTALWGGANTGCCYMPLGRQCAHQGACCTTCSTPRHGQPHVGSRGPQYKLKLLKYTGGPPWARGAPWGCTRVYRRGACAGTKVPPAATTPLGEGTGGTATSGVTPTRPGGGDVGGGNVSSAKAGGQSEGGKVVPGGVPMEGKEVPAEEGGGSEVGVYPPSRSIWVLHVAVLEV